MTLMMSPMLISGPILYLSTWQAVFLRQALLLHPIVVTLRWAIMMMMIVFAFAFAFAFVFVFVFVFVFECMAGGVL